MIYFLFSNFYVSGATLLSIAAILLATECQRI